MVTRLMQSVIIRTNVVTFKSNVLILDKKANKQTNKQTKVALLNFEKNCSKISPKRNFRLPCMVREF